MYFTKHSDEEVQTKAIIGLGKLSLNFIIVLVVWAVEHILKHCESKQLIYLSMFLIAVGSGI